jgi:hypothetical protein
MQRQTEGELTIGSPDRRSRPQAQSRFTGRPLPGAIQPKLAVGPVDDPLERSADSVAEQVMRMPDAALSVTTASPQLSCKCSKASRISHAAVVGFGKCLAKLAIALFPDCQS